MPYAIHRAEGRSIDSHYVVTIWSQSFPNVVPKLILICPIFFFQSCTNVILKLYQICLHGVPRLPQVVVSNLSQSCLKGEGGVLAVARSFDIAEEVGAACMPNCLLYMLYMWWLDQK